MTHMPCCPRRTAPTSARWRPEENNTRRFQTFAGPRDDPFFADLGSIFDLAGLRPLNPAHLVPLPAEPGRDDLARKNVHMIAIQIPESRFVGNDPVVGVCATTSRRFVKVLNNQGGNFQFGP